MGGILNRKPEKSIKRTSTNLYIVSVATSKHGYVFLILKYFLLVSYLAPQVCNKLISLMTYNSYNNIGKIDIHE